MTQDRKLSQKVRMCIRELMDDGGVHRAKDIISCVSARLEKNAGSIEKPTIKSYVYQEFADTSKYVRLDFGLYQSMDGFLKVNDISELSKCEDRRTSTIKKAKQYVSELLGDGNVHTAGELIAFVNERFEKDGRTTEKTTVKRAVEKALSDTAACVWLGYGRYQLKSAYLNTHDLTNYVAQRVETAVKKAVAEVTECIKNDLAGADKGSGAEDKIYSATVTVLEYLKKCENIVTDALTQPESEKLSVLERIAADRENKRQAKAVKRDIFTPGKKKSHREEL